jgi:hypothetical protein
MRILYRSTKAINHVALEKLRNPYLFNFYERLVYFLQRRKFICGKVALAERFRCSLLTVVPNRVMRRIKEKKSNLSIVDPQQDIVDRREKN